MNDALHPAAQRVAETLRDSEDPVAALVGSPGADLTSFLLAVAQGRAAAINPAAVVRQTRSDRLVEPAHVEARALHRTVTALLDALPPEVDVLELSPVAPLGACSAVASVDQKKIVSTMRGNEVAADPTNVLALVAATRPGPEHRLAAVQRVLRTQPMGTAGQQHFTVLGLVTAGRDRGNLDFERDALVATAQTVVAALAACGINGVDLRVTSLRDRFTDDLVDDVRDALGTTATVLADPDRVAGRGYYRDLCFKVVAHAGPDEVEVGDGGFTDWTARLTGDRKRRTLIAGLGVDRIAALTRP